MLTTERLVKVALVEVSLREGDQQPECVLGANDEKGRCGEEVHALK